MSVKVLTFHIKLRVVTYEDGSHYYQEIYLDDEYIVLKESKYSNVVSVIQSNLNTKEIEFILDSFNSPSPKPDNENVIFLEVFARRSKGLDI